MSTINKINSNIPIEISKGGTQSSAFTNEAVVYYDGTQLQSVAGATAGNVFTSTGTGSAPYFVALPTFFPIVAGDPASPSAGDTWYNSNTNLYRGCKTSGGGGAWVVKAPVPVTSVTGAALAGSSGASALIAGGGWLGSSGGSQGVTFSYDGLADAWTSQTNLPSQDITHTYPMSYGIGMTGDPTLAFAFGASTNVPGDRLYSVHTLLYSSSVWTFKADMTSNQSVFGFCGVASDTLLFAGYFFNTVTSNETLLTQRYNGGSNTWTNKAFMNHARVSCSGAGTAADALAMGGTGTSGSLNTTERYDGVGNAWTNKANFTGIRSNSGASGATGGTSMLYGGYDYSPGTFYNDTQQYDGLADTWTTIGATLNLARFNLASCGSNSDALATGGTYNTSAARTNLNERFNGISTTNVTFTLT